MKTNRNDLSSILLIAAALGAASGCVKTEPPAAPAAQAASNQTSPGAVAAPTVADAQPATRDAAMTDREAAAAKRAAAARDGGLSTATTRQPNLGTTPAKPEAPAASSSFSGPQVVIPEPAEIDLGRVHTSTKPVPAVLTLRNTGDQPMKLIDAKTSCGCTTAKVPRGEFIAPGGTAEIEVKVSPGLTSQPNFHKNITIKIEGQSDLVVGVKAEVVAYVVMEPDQIDPATIESTPIVIRSIDDQPFKLVSMTPELAVLPTEPATRHEVMIDRVKYDAMGMRKMITFAIDHPKCETVQGRFKTAPRSVTLGDQDAVGPDGHPLPVRDAMSAGHEVISIVSRGDLAGLAALIEKGTNLEVLDSTGATPIIIAAKTGNIEMIDALAKAGAKLEAHDRAGRTALSHATWSGKPEAVKALIDLGANVNAKDETGGTPIYWAAGERGSAEATALLLAAKADTTIPNLFGFTPMIWAAGYGSPEQVAAMVKGGADVNQPGGPDERAPLAFAAQFKTAESVKLLLEAGADVNAKDKNGLTALDVARSREATQTAKDIIALLEAAFAQAPAKLDATPTGTSSGAPSGH
jgi:hypothetical protein